MKAALIRSFGHPDVISYADVDECPPRPGHVLVRVAAAGANYYDTLIRRGIVSTAIPLPHVGGSDVVGTVEQVGAAVDGWQVGDKVIVAPGYPTEPAEQEHRPENEAPSYFPAGTFQWGGYAQYMHVPGRWLLRDDTRLAAPELATMPLVLVTAVHAVKTLARVSAGAKVLVQAGASGSGSMAIQVAKALGATVAATVSTDEKAEVAKQAGADLVIRYRESDVAAIALEFSDGMGVDAVIDPVGGASLEGSLKSLRPRGALVNFGLAGGAAATIPSLYPFFRNELRILGSWMGSIEELKFGLELVRQGLVHPIVDRVMPLAAAAEAHRLIEAHAVAGKIALLPWEQD